MDERKRCSIKLVFYENKVEGGQLNGATSIVVAADSVAEAVPIARELLGEDCLRNKQGYFVESVVEFAAAIAP